MPFAVMYMMALSAWIFVACMIWCAAGLLCVLQRTRRLACAMKAEGMGATEIAKALKIGRASVYRALEGA
jgi:hypothetical protein